MKKAFQDGKLSNPSKFVRRVLSKTSSSDMKLSEKSKNKVKENPLSFNMEQEISALKEQVSILQMTISEMQHDSDKKEKALADIVREKERLTSDLRKQKRSNVNLKQQLEDEREYYFKEKQQYCQEMNNCKKLKNSLSKSETNLTDTNIIHYKKENLRFKKILNQTLEANYNLSIKFLRMKNTKTNLRNRLKELQNEHDKTMADLKAKIEYIKSEIHDIIENQFKLPITPSSKKYLRIVKQNGNLIHENLCLQLEVDHLHEKIQNIKTTQLKKETNSKLQLINSKTKYSSDNVKSDQKIIKQTKQEQQKDPNKTLKRNSKKLQRENDVVKKIFEKTVKADIPLIIENQNVNMVTSYAQTSPRYNIKDNSSSKLTLVQVSENPSCNSTELNYLSSYKTSCTAVRTQSAPEIVQSSLFSNDKSNYSSVVCSLINE